MRGLVKLSKDAPRNTPERTGVLIRPPFNVLTNHCHPPKVQHQQPFNLRLVTLIGRPLCLRHQKLRHNSTQLVWWEARCMRWILAPAAGQGTNLVVLFCLLFAEKLKKNHCFAWRANQRRLFGDTIFFFVSPSHPLVSVSDP